MSREKNIRVCKENREIVKRNGYELGGRSVELFGDLRAHQRVNVLTPELIGDIMEDKDDFFEKAFYGSSECRISVVNADSFAYKTELVMNFANAMRPGGGYLNGANAQEEALCRQSTLYASISSGKAYEMYEHNRQLNAPFDSDYMLLSPNVVVFRDKDLNLLEQPYATAVMTIPAPNLNGRAHGQDPQTVATVMKERIRQYLYCAARYRYRTLTLGAWGCGAFGHDAKVVAGYFYELLVKEEMWQFFDAILFAVYDQSPEQYNYNAFKERFADAAVNVSELFPEEAEDDPDDPDGYPGYYIQTEKPFPICNHTQGITSVNLGYCQGVTSDGMPFEAELWENDAEKAITIIMPEFADLTEISERETENASDDSGITGGAKVIGFKSSHDYYDESVLWIGMVECGQEQNDDVLHFYVDYLKEMGLVEFTGNVENGSLIYCTDAAGTDLVHVTVALEDENEVGARTSLRFRPFWGGPDRGRIIPIR